MEHISNLVTPPTTSCSATEAKEPGKLYPVTEEAMKLTTYVFRRLRTLYPGLFESQWKHSNPTRATALHDALKLEWANQIGEFSERVVNYALDSLKTSEQFRDKPPKVLQFWKLCADQRRELQAEIRSSEFIGLPKPKPTPEQKAKYKADLRAALNGETKP